MKTFTYTLTNQSVNSLIDFATYKDEKNILVQIFCGGKKNILENILNIMTKELPNAVCIGSSTDGEIDNSEITTLTTVIVISIFEKTTLETSYVEGKDSFKNGATLASKLCNEKNRTIETYIHYQN